MNIEMPDLDFDYLAFNQSIELLKTLGCIGILKARFTDSDRTNITFSWISINEQDITHRFLATLSNLLIHFRKFNSGRPSFLYSRKKLKEFCEKNKDDLAIDKERNVYGIKIIDNDYIFYFKLYPEKENICFKIYCYEKSTSDALFKQITQMQYAKHLEAKVC